MCTYQIVTDSCCDFTLERYARRNVACAPLTFRFRNQEFQNFSEDAQLKEFYDALRAGHTGTTSAVNPERWAETMIPFLDRGQDILCLTFSSALSATAQSARMAGEELREKYPQRKIIVIDTLCAALGQGLLVELACRLRDQGSSLEETARWVENNKLRLAHWVTVDDLDHLKRGGRISAATALVGSMLNIKPIIHVDDSGALVNVGKCRGRRAAIDTLARQLQQDIEEHETIAIGHGDCPQDAAYLEEKIRQLCPQVQEVITGYVGGVIGAHTGPGVLALFYLGKKR